MRYQGGKSRIAKEIAAVISERERERERESNKTFVSLFCGSCAVEAKVTGYDRIICNDNHEYLIALLKAVQQGYELPEHISEEQYKYIKEHKDEDKALAGFVGFGCSYGGKWFDGYAKGEKGRNYALGSKHTLLKDMATLMTAKFTCLDYRDVNIPDNSVVYCDPPYRNTTSYKNGKFNTDDFWNYMRVISKNNAVYISEQEAPDDFVCLWEKPLKRCLSHDSSKYFTATEKLFTYKNIEGEF